MFFITCNQAFIVASTRARITNDINMDFQLDILNTISEPTSFVDKNYRYVFVNKAYSNYYQCPPSQIMGKPISDFLGKTTFEQIIKPHIDKCLNGQQVIYETLVFINAQIGERYMQMHYYPHYNEQNEIDGIISTARDKTDTYYLSQNWLGIKNNIDDVVCTIDKNHNILDINKFGLKAINKTLDEVVGAKCYDIFHQCHNPPDYCPLSKGLKTKKTEATEYFEIILGKHFSIKTSPIFDKNGELSHFIAIMRDISLLKEKEANLKDANEEYESVNSQLKTINFNYELISQYSSDAIAMYDENMTPLYISPSAINHSGYQPEELMDLDVFDLVHPEDKESLLKEITKKRQHNINNYTTTYRVKHKKGHYFWNESVTHIVDDAHTRKTFIIVNNRNIDDRKKAEHALKESEFSYRLLVDNINDLICEIDEDGRFTYLNKQYKNILGYNTEELMGSKAIDIIHPDDLQESLEKYEELKNQEQQRIDIWRFRHKNGTYRIIESKGAVYELSKSQKRTVVISRDVTESKMAEKALQESEKIKSLVLGSTQELFAYYDTNLKVKWANNAAAASVGLEPKDLEGRHCYEIWHKRKTPCQDCPLIEVKKTQKPQEAQLKTPDNRYWQIRGYPVLDENNQLTGLVEFGQDITERVLNEQKVSEANQRYHTIATNFPNGAIFLYDKNHRYLHVAGAEIQEIGLNADELPGKRAEEVFPSGVANIVMKHQPLVFKGEAVYYELEFAGNIYANWGVPIRDANGQIEEGLTYVLNISEVKNSERRLKEAEHIGRLGHVDWDVLNRKAYWSDEVFEIYEIDPEDNTPDYNTIMELHKPEDAERLKNAVQSSIITGVGYELDVVANLPSGKTKFLHAIGSPVKNESGKVINIRGTVQDITERKIYENELKKAKEIAEINQLKYKTIFEGAPIGIFRSTLSGKFIEVNPTLAHMLGYDNPQEVIDNIYNIADQIYVNGSKRAKIVGKTTKTNISKHDNIYRRKNGEEFNANLFLRKILDERGNEVLEGIVEDTTERKKYEQKLKDALEKAEISNKLKTEFINNMSHEVRTPMNAIMGFSQMLGRPNITPDKKDYYTRLIQANSNQLLKIIDNILEILRLETSKAKLYPETFCLNDLVENLRYKHAKQIPSKVAFNLIKSLPDKDCTIATDKSKLFKILSILLENAIKFTDKGSIEIAYTFNDKQLEIYVKDTGKGIDTHKKERIFDRFSHEDITVAREKGGLGIGLNIAKKYTELLGGKIGVKSKKGKGSTFFIIIPRSIDNNE